MTEKQIADLDGKIKMLHFKLNKTDDIIAKRDRQALDRHQTAISGIVSAVDTLKNTIEEKKFAKGEREEEIATWSQGIEEHLEKADDTTRRLQKAIKTIDMQEEEEQAVEKHKQNMVFERELLEQKEQFEKNREEQRAVAQTTEHHSSAAKLPKLTITKFNGRLEEWLPFWGKFTTEIDSTSLPPLTKFGYLKELLEKHVRADIDGLPYTEEGYENAKAILEAEYGQPTEIVNAYVKNIMELPVITGTHPRKVKEFYKQLRFNVQSLDTLGRLADVKGNVRSTLDKLKGIKAGLVRGNESWKDWGFKDLLTELKKWTDINPVEESVTENPGPRKGDSLLFPPSRGSRVFKTQFKYPQQGPRGGNQCVYCEDTEHRSIDCTEVAGVDDRRKILYEKRLCFNCTGARHRADECTSKLRCQICNRKHHTSLCQENNADALLVATGIPTTHVTYPVVIVEVQGIKRRALLDTGAGSSYASAALLDRISKSGKRKREVRKIEMLLGTSSREVELAMIDISDVNRKSSMPVEVTKVDKGELLFLDNPRYQEMIAKYPHLSGVVMDDLDTKCRLPVHLILGAGEYAKLKTENAPKIGEPGQPIAELTKFGWTIISPGKEPLDLANVLLTQTSHVDYEELCRLDVLGLTDTPPNDQRSVYAEFKEQLMRDKEGWYETGLPWRGDHPVLPNNKEGSLRRLGSLNKRLERQNLTSEYEEIIEDQKKAGVVERADEPCVGGREFYIPHKPVVQATAESTKLRVVYDASARAFDGAPSLNDSLHAGPPLQNKLWSVLVRGRFNPVAINGDLQKAFLQVRVRETDRDAMRFHWRREEHSPLETLRFTRAVFGLASSPFLLGGVIEVHLNSWEEKEPELVAKIRKELYVDDLISGSTTVHKTRELKDKASAIFKDACFHLHKWHSNVPELESAQSPKQEGEPTYAKQQLGVPQGEFSSVLGLPWNKEHDLLSITVPSEKAMLTKRGILAKLAKIYDPLGLVSPETLSGKLIYRAACDTKRAWDAELPRDLAKAWIKWESGLPQWFDVPRSLAVHREDIEHIELHSFGDACANRVAAFVYGVVRQASGTNQGLIAARSRLAKQGLTIPRLELVAGHMAVNLVANVRNALDGLPISSTHCWLDSSVALYWIRGQGEYKQFVANRVEKINSHGGVTWRYVPTEGNPADLGSRGGRVNGSHLWWDGPEWLATPEHWPADVLNQPTKESQVEAKLVQKVLAVAVDGNDEIKKVLHQFQLQKAIRVCAWMRRFAPNCLRSRRASRIVGPLTTEETDRQRLFWERQAQQSCDIERDRVALNLQPNQEELLECRGRVQGEYPIYLPYNSMLSLRLTEEAHRQTLHGGVGLTMAKVRSRYWIPRLRQLVRKVRGACHGCKRFQALAYAAPPPGNLPTTRTHGTNPYQVIGVDYAGPIRYRVSKKREGKAYVLLYACSLTRGIYLDLLLNLETAECLRSLKKFIAHRGRPERIYSDNGRTFVGAAEWMKTVMKDERLQTYLSTNQIKWQFNLSRAPWWGGQFERFIGLVKTALNKTIGNGMLRWEELQEVLLDVEINLNSRPLSYVEDDVQLPLLTPNSMLFLNSNVLPELQPYHIETADLRKRAKHLLKCKEAMWRRWSQEYLRSLRERHRAQAGTGGDKPSFGAVVIIKSEDKNRGKWPLAIVEDLIVGNDGVVRGARLRTGKSYVERAVQHLYPLELSCDRQLPAPVRMNPEVAPFRPRRDAAVAARLRLEGIARDEE